MQTKNYLPKKSVGIVLFFAFILSCSKEEIKNPSSNLQVLKASNQITANLQSFWTSNKLVSSDFLKGTKFDLSSFNVSNLSEIKLTLNGNSNSSYAILSSNNPAIALLIDFDVNGSISSLAFTENIPFSKDSIESKIYDFDGNLRVDFLTVNKNIFYKDVPSSANGRVSSFASYLNRTGNCISQLQPTSNGLYNLLFDAAATAATGGWYPAVVITACLIRSAEK